MNWLINPEDSLQDFLHFGGGKATNMARMSKLPKISKLIPPWFCINAKTLDYSVKTSKLILPRVKAGDDLAATRAAIEKALLEIPLPAEFVTALQKKLNSPEFSGKFLAVRSSGLDEDSAEHSFAGQFSTFLYRKGEASVVDAIRRCWASAYSERALAYRLTHGLPISDLKVGVVIQEMVSADCAGVAFSRNPTRPLDRDSIVISSVWGLGEGLVSGELDADHFEFSREKQAISKTRVVPKAQKYIQASQAGIRLSEVPADQINAPSLNNEQIFAVAELTQNLEDALGSAQDCEWAFSGNKLYCLQTRPITTLPPASFFNKAIIGETATLWDNSNIVESYSGVTTPFTFTFAREAYEQVYLQFCEVMGVPKALIEKYEPVFRNMLGLIRGRVYYNLINWYKLVLTLPGSSSNKGFMETMMGVKQGLRPELAELFEFVKTPPKYSFAAKAKLIGLTLWRFKNKDRIVHDFMKHFNRVYENARRMNFRQMSLSGQLELYFKLQKELLFRWHAPIINDYLCMLFFGLLKKNTEQSLQNDLLCGQGDLESTEPTKMLMRIAAQIDKGPAELRSRFLTENAETLWADMQKGELQDIAKQLRDFLDRYGFRCVNELKLEEPDLHDNPAFVINAVQGYIRLKSYSIADMEQRELAIRLAAEEKVRGQLSLVKRPLYFWILKEARLAVKNRENLRFARTKIFGIIRHLVRAMGANLVALNQLDHESDVFYLTLDELISYIEGRSATLDLKAMTRSRRAEYDRYRKEPNTPSRFMTFGAAGVSFAYPMVVSDADLLRDDSKPREPGVLHGTSCCPGVVEGVVRVARTLKDAENLNGEILVTERTDPGWVPLYPNCSCLLIERGSLLSHSAVVARELGLPTIVGVEGGLLDQLETGMRVRVDAGKGEIRVLSGR